MTGTSETRFFTAGQEVPLSATPNPGFQTVGWIVLAVGIMGLVLSMIFWSSWGGPGYFTSRRRTYVEEGPAAPPPY